MANRVDEPIQVFISYTHDSDEHKQRVLALAQKLRQDGLDASIDRFINGTPKEGWPLWMERRLERAAFVLIVCTETYLRRYRGEEEAGRGLGATWEAMQWRQALYEAQGKNIKFIPVLFDKAAKQFIPTALRPATHYLLPGDYEPLYRCLTDQPAVIPAPLGNIRSLPPDP